MCYQCAVEMRSNQASGRSKASRTGVRVWEAEATQFAYSGQDMVCTVSTGDSGFWSSEAGPSGSQCVCVCVCVC